MEYTFVPGKLYSVEEVKKNGFNPCFTCTMPNQCASQCMWAYGRYEKDVRYYWDGSKTPEGQPFYSNWTWHRVKDETDLKDAEELFKTFITGSQ